MFEKLLNEDAKVFTFFYFVTKRQPKWQRVVVTGTFLSAICLLIKSTVAVYRYQSLQDLLQFILVVMLLIITGVLDTLFKARVIKQHYPRHYISPLNWDKQGLLRERKKNFDIYRQELPQLSDNAINAYVDRTQAQGDSIFKAFENLSLAILEGFFKALNTAYPAQLPFTVLLLFFTYQFFAHLRTCWEDIHENILTDIGTCQQFNRIAN